VVAETKLRLSKISATNLFEALDKDTLKTMRSKVDSVKREPNLTDFALIKRIGKGSFGQAFLAVDTKSRKPYCIKISATSSSNGCVKFTSESEDIQNEKDILLQIDHQNIMKLWN